MFNKIQILVVLVLWGLPSLKAQESFDKLNLDKAIQTALEHNYDLKIAKNQLQAVQNNNSIGNAGMLPSVSLSGGASYGINDTESETATVVINQDDVETTQYNGSARVDYTLFDGFGNRYTYKKLKQLDAQQQVIFKQQMEMTILQVVQLYYQACSAQQNLKLAKESMQISTERYIKAVDRKKYGQANTLDVLNAEVDMNSDSTRILNTEQAYLMAIKDLNVALGIPVGSEYSVIDDLSFDKIFNQEQVVEKALANNTSLQTQLQQEEITQLDLKLAKAGRYPTLSAYGEYSYSQVENSAGFTLYNKSNGINSGLSLRFNVFNGQQQRTKVKNAKLNVLNEQERTQLAKSELERDAINAYTDYTYKKRIVDLQQSSLVQAELNFEQTKEMFKLGRVTSIEFRTAQQNMLNVANNYNDARFNAKVSEYNLMQITGELLGFNE